MAVNKANSSNRMNALLLEERCVLNKVLKITGRRWVAEILLLVEMDVNRFSQLRINLKGISDHILSKNLNELCISGLLTKKIYQQVPLKVEYYLSSSGKTLLIQLHGLCAWGKKNIEE